MSNQAKKEYKMLKNFLHNDCGITKESIKNLVEEEVHTQINELFKSSNATNIEDIVHKKILELLCGKYGGLSYKTTQLIEDTERSLEIMRNKAIEKAIAENIIVSLKEKV